MSTPLASRPDTSSAEQAARILRAMADGTRLRCLLLIANHGELCVCELVHALALSQPMVSRHLKRLRDDELVCDRRDGTWMHYRLGEAIPPWARNTLQTMALAHRDQPPFAEDAQRLAQMPDRPPRCDH